MKLRPIPYQGAPGASGSHEAESQTGSGVHEAPHYKRARDFDRDCQRVMGKLRRAAEPATMKIVHNMQSEDDDMHPSRIGRCDSEAAFARTVGYGRGGL